jgi:2-polyprenyl-6-methoxyphenol hydroxylase-like FAD-dependent oxidoreductase
VHKATQPLVQPIYDLDSPQLAFGRVVLLGDAAFVARPHCGMGVTKAAGDAKALTQSLMQMPDDPVQALKAYDSKRQPTGRFLVGHARSLGAYMQAQILTPEERQMAERYRSVEAVMRETAVSPALH